LSNTGTEGARGIGFNANEKETLVSTNKTFLAVFVGSKTSPRMKAWMALSEAERHAKEQTGIAAWQAWMEKHLAAVVAGGGPLGKTKTVTGHGIDDASNDLSAFVIVQAESHEAAAKLFEKHPHFTIFPGESIEVMPVLPIPGA
jgi:hypothetical protein